jgi:hypothetical protein
MKNKVQYVVNDKTERVDYVKIFFVNKKHEYTLVDLETFQRYLEYYPNYTLSITAEKYATFNKILLHRWIMGVENQSRDKVIDHINGDSLDNRKYNLRITNQSENCSKGRLRTNNSTGYIGIAYNKKLKKYIAKLTHNYKTHRITSTADLEEAVKKRNEFIVLNGFDKLGYQVQRLP